MQVRKNLIANFAGQGWVALMNIAFVPLYIGLLGMEAFGLIGFFALLQAWLSILDLGIVPTTAREMARFASGAMTADAVRDLLRTFETICLGLGVLIAGVFCGAAGPLGTGWFEGAQLEPATISTTIALMGLVVALRLGEALYRSVLIGLQHQVWLNVAAAAIATLRTGGAVIVLMVFDATVEAFFLWQAFLSLCATAVLAVKSHKLIPRPSRAARFSSEALRSVGRFAAGMLGINLLALLLTQSDKIILSRLLPLQEYGHYMLAWTLAAQLGLLIAPVVQAVYPVLIRHVQELDGGEGAVFHRYAQFLSAILLPAGLTLTFLAHPLLFAWTGDDAIARSTSQLLSLLSIGTLFNALLHMPYYLSLAHGWTRLTLAANAAAVVILVPLLLLLVPRHGALVGAWVWAGLNFVYMVLLATRILATLLPGELGRWITHDLLRPAVPALIILGAASVVPISGESRLAQAVFVVGIAGIALLGSLLTVDGAFARLRRLLPARKQRA